jgi:hypothetical protein
MSLVGESSSWGSELEGPDEVVGLLEVGSAGVDLVDQILNTDDSVLSEVLLDDCVVWKRNSLSVDVGEPSLVEKSLDGLSRRVSKDKKWNYPKVTYGSTLLMRFIEALLILTKVALWSCLSLRILMILTTLGFILLIPLILTMMATLAAAGT